MGSTESKVEKKPTFVLPKQFEYDGAIFAGTVFNKETLDKAKEFKFKESDIVLTTFTRSGTTWTSEQLFLILNDVDEEKANSASISDRVPFLELVKGPQSGLDLAADMPDPRLLKTHLPAQFFGNQIKEGKPKIIFVVRNPKDTLVSYYHFYEMNVAYGKFTGTFQEYLELHYSGQLCEGDWYDFTLSWWDMKDDENVLVLHYEEMKDDPVSAVKKMATFCGKELTEEQVKRIVYLTSFAQMKDNPNTNYADFNEKGIFDFSVNSFMRAGNYGGWKKYFSKKDNKRFDAHHDEKTKGKNLQCIFG